MSSNETHALSVNPATGQIEYRKLTLKEILQRCAELGGRTPDDLKGKARHTSIAEARAEFCRRAHEAGYSWPEIGMFIKRPHSTCMKIAKRKIKTLGKQTLMQMGDSKEK